MKFYTTFVLCPSLLRPVLETLSFYYIFPVPGDFEFFRFFPVSGNLKFFRFFWVQETEFERKILCTGIFPGAGDFEFERKNSRYWSAKALKTKNVDKVSTIRKKKLKFNM